MNLRMSVLLDLNFAFKAFSEVQLRVRSVVVSEGLCRPPVPNPPYERIELLYECLIQRLLLTMLADECTQPRKAEHLPLGVMGLNQAVSVEESAIALLEYYLLLLIAHLRHQTQGHTPCP